MMKGFLYLRQSVGQADPDDSLSIETQHEECLKFAKAHGIKVQGVFREANHSGRLYPTGYEALAAIDSTYKKWCEETKKTGQWRKQLGEMLKRLDEVECIVCFDITRLHRSLRGSFLENLLMQTLVQHKVKVITIKEGEIDFGKFTDSLVTMLTSQINSEQLQIQKEKSKASMKKLKDAGEWSGECYKSFGYRSTGRKREVEIDEMKAEMVRKIYAGYIAGMSYWRISHEINPAYYEATGKSLFKTHMFRILRNPIYCGYYRDSTGELVKAKPIEGKEIIDFSTWKKAQELLHEHRAYPKRDKVNWLPISGRVYCGVCGDRMRGIESNGRFVQYRCVSYSKHGMAKSASCKNGVNWEIKGEQLPGGDSLSRAFFGLLPIYYMQKLANAEAERSMQHEKEDAEVAVVNIQSKMKTLTASFLEGLLDDGLYKSNLEALNRKLKEAKEKLDALKRLDNKEYDAAQLLIDLEALNSGDIDEAELNEALMWTVQKLTLWRDRAEVATPIGNVSLPIRRANRFGARLLPWHFIVTSNDCCDVVYHWRFPEVNAEHDIFNYEDEAKLIASFGKVRIFLEG